MGSSHLRTQKLGQRQLLFIVNDTCLLPPTELERLKNHPATLQGKVEIGLAVCKYPLLQQLVKASHARFDSCGNGSTELFTTPLRGINLNKMEEKLMIPSVFSTTCI